MRYPEALWLGNGQSGGSYTGGPYRVVLHTTETAGLPSYSNGATAPHLTYNPEFRKFYQHTDFSTAARALANPSGGVHTNRRSAIQLEIICYSAKSVADQTESRMWVGDLTDNHYEDLSRFVDWCVTEFDVDKVWPGKQAFNYSEANTAGFRMTDGAWNAFGGVCGHQHVPENTHWDPGAFDWNKLLGDMMTPAQEAKLDALAVKVETIYNVLGINPANPNVGGVPTLRYTDSNLSHYLRQILPADTASKSVQALAVELSD